LPVIDAEATPVTQRGDLWLLGKHRQLCGDALDADSYALLMGTDQAQMMFADPPDSLSIEGPGAAMKAATDVAAASGESYPSAYQALLRTALGHAARHSVNCSIHYVCMDWRHQRELMAAGDEVYDELLNLCVWTKSQAESGSLYRSQHEFIFVFKVGKGVNKVSLGRDGRHRSDVWDYVSDNRLNGGAKSKPVALIADAMRDCSHRGDLVLDPFGRYGTTLIAAEQTGRRARVIERNPMLVDASIERWQRLTGGTARRADTGQPFARSASVAVGGSSDDKA
jgi:DNA modification methylase